MNVIAYKFQAPNGAYWYIRADDQRTIDYWKDKRKLIPLSDKQARIAAGVVVERPQTPPLVIQNENLRLRALLAECEATLAAWADMAPAVSLRADIRKALETTDDPSPIQKHYDDRDFRKDIETVINRHSRENGSNTPAFILTQYLVDCLGAFDNVVQYRDEWHSSDS